MGGGKTKYCAVHTAAERHALTERENRKVESENKLGHDGMMAGKTRGGYKECEGFRVMYYLRQAVTRS